MMAEQQVSPPELPKKLSHFIWRRLCYSDGILSVFE